MLATEFDCTTVRKQRKKGFFFCKEEKEDRPLALHKNTQKTLGGFYAHPTSLSLFLPFFFRTPTPTHTLSLSETLISIWSGCGEEGLSKSCCVALISLSHLNDAVKVIERAKGRAGYLVKVPCFEDRRHHIITDAR